MSAYVVEDITINRIISFLNSLMPHSEARKAIEALGYDLDSLCSLERLGDTMLELNIFSVLARYRGDLDMIPDEPFVLEYVRDLNPMQARKSLSCFLYQSCEGNAENDPLFTALRVVSDMMQAMPKDRVAYEEADWG